MKSLYLGFMVVIFSLFISSLSFADSPAGNTVNPDAITEAGTGNCPGGVNSCEKHRDPENHAVNRMAEADKAGRVIGGKKAGGSVAPSDATQ